MVMFLYLLVFCKFKQRRYTAAMQKSLPDNSFHLYHLSSFQNRLLISFPKACRYSESLAAFSLTFLSRQLEKSSGIHNCLLFSTLLRKSISIVIQSDLLWKQMTSICSLFQILARTMRYESITSLLRRSAEFQTIGSKRIVPNNRKCSSRP